ncbi:MAG: molybdopterin-dependent oxidoreductase [Sphingomonas fennica]
MPPDPARTPAARRAPAGPIVSRRQLLVGGGAGVGLVVAWGLWPRRYRPNLVAAPGETILGAYLKIGEDGHVTVVVPQAETGQGAWTALPQMLADELGADWRTIGVEPAPISPLYANAVALAEGIAGLHPSAIDRALAHVGPQAERRAAWMLTAGSSSIRAFEPPLRAAGAAARALLCMAAAERFNADWQALDTAAGFVTHGEEKIRFGEVAAAAVGFAPPTALPLREPGEGGISGRAVPRIDHPSKVDGTAQYAGDVRLPGLVHAAVRTGGPGETVAAVDEAAARAVPGVVAIVRREGWVAVVAANGWAAERAAAAARIRFAGGTPIDDAAIAAALATAMAGGGEVIGTAAEAPAGGVRHTADYALPSMPHATIEPLAATARLAAGRLEIWAPTQAPALARAAAARAAGLGEAQVTLFPTFVGGGFGRKLEMDAIAQAAAIAVEAKRPVQLSWSREEETARGRHGAPALVRLAATLGGDGAVAAWEATVASPAIGHDAAARLRDGDDTPTTAADPEAVAGAETCYAFPAVTIRHAPAAIGLATGVWRSGARAATCFATESFMDELAAASGQDPLGFRIRHLGGQPRLARCLQRVTAAGGWSGPGGGQGLAVHAAYGSVIALLVEAERRGTGIAVPRVVAAVDAGRLIHPDSARQQIESGIVWALAHALGPGFSYAGGRPVARGFAGLGLPLIGQIPEIEVQMIDSREAPGGIAELAVPPLAPALANALAAGGAPRLRRLPLGERA